MQVKAHFGTSPREPFKETTWVGDDPLYRLKRVVNQTHLALLSKVAFG